jgi:hypothetical protein
MCALKLTHWQPRCSVQPQTHALGKHTFVPYHWFSMLKDLWYNPYGSSSRTENKISIPHNVGHFECSKSDKHHTLAVVSFWCIQILTGVIHIDSEKALSRKNMYRVPQCDDI